MALGNGSLPESFLQMRKAEKLVDITLVFGERRMSCHKVILAGMCDYFYRMFLTDMAESTKEVVMKDISASTGVILVDYLYTQQVEITTQNAQDLLAANEMLLLGTLKQSVEEFLCRHTESTNCISTINLARMYGLKTLLEDARKFLHDHLQEVISTEEMHILQETDLVDILAANDSQEESFCLVQKWVRSAPGGRNDRFITLIEHVRLSECCIQFICSTVMHEELLQNAHGMQLIQQFMQSYLLTDQPEQQSLVVGDSEQNMVQCTDSQHSQPIQKPPLQYKEYSACASQGGRIFSDEKHTDNIQNHWSPLNPEGKKQYDRAFLLQLQFTKASLEKPTNLPIIRASIIPPANPKSAGRLSQGRDSRGHSNTSEDIAEVPVVPQDDDEEIRMEEEKVEDSIDQENGHVKKGRVELRYEYKKYQWSPLNPGGKKQYDRAFLLQLQFAEASLEKPTNLPRLDVILDAPMTRHSEPTRGPPSMKQMKHEKAMLIQSLPPQDKRRGGGGGGAGPGPQQSDDGWTSVFKRAPQMDPKRMNIRINKVEGDIQLGPGGRGGFTWARGSSGGSKPSSQEAEKSSASAPANRFSALSGADADHRGRGSSATRSSMPPPANPKSAGRLSQGPDSRGRNITRGSRDQNCEYAIAAARNITRTGTSNRSAPGSRNQSRESSRNRERSREPPTPEAARPAPVAQPSAKEFTDEEIERKTTYLVDELLLNNDLNEAVLSVKDIESPAKHDKIVYAVLNHVLERSEKARAGSAKLLAELLVQRIISIAKFTQGWVDILEFADDLATDIPNIWAYFGELIAPSLVSGALPFAALQDICKPCLGCLKAHVLAAAVLKAMADVIGIENVADAWRLAQLQWQDFAPATCDLNEFLTRNKLEMLNASELTMGQIKTELLRVVQPKMPNDGICKWIADNITEVQRKDSQFVRALMAAVCSSVIIEHEAKTQLNVAALKERATLLQIYLDHDGNLELQALYALQALMVSMHHPSGLLQTFFDVMYDEDLISEDSFFKWHTSDDAAEAGKGVARHSVGHFFAWLHERSEDQDDA